MGTTDIWGEELSGLEWSRALQCWTMLINCERRCLTDAWFVVMRPPMADGDVVQFSASLSPGHTPEDFQTFREAISGWEVDPACLYGRVSFSDGSLLHWDDGGRVFIERFYGPQGVEVCR